VERMEGKAVRACLRRPCGRGTRRPGVLLAFLSILVAPLGCAPWQVVAVTAGPAPVELFVDGERVKASADGDVRLRADRNHVLHFERPGYRAQQVVVRSVREAGEPVLEPARVRVELRPVETRTRHIDVELQPIQVEEGGEK
jgi:hypothetical protein